MHDKFKYNHIKSKAIDFAFIFMDFILVFLKVKYPLKKNRKTILFIGEYFPARIQRIVKYLRTEQKAELVLYISSWGYEPKLIGKHFHRVEIYRNKFHLRRLLNAETEIVLIHAFEPKAYYQYLAFTYTKVPFIYDIQDITITYFGMNPPQKWQRKNLKYEKRILELADGYISHSLELSEAMRLHHIKNSKPRLFFPLYCDSSNFKPIKQNTQLCNTPKLVYIGGINDTEEHSSSNFLPLIKKLKPLHVQFTIFPSPIGEKKFFTEYKSLESQFPNFKMKESVAFDALDLSPYHFGIVPFEHDSSEVYFSKNKYASTLKFFVYLDMGLPIIVSEYWAFPAWICKRYKLGIVTNYNDLGNLEKTISKLNYTDILNNISAFRNKFDLKLEIKRLITFYNSFIEDKI